MAKQAASKLTRSLFVGSTVLASAITALGSTAALATPTPEPADPAAADTATGDLSPGRGFTRLAKLAPPPAGPANRPSSVPPGRSPAEIQTAQVMDNASDPDTVGTAPADEESPYLGWLSAGGVLTPQGMLIVENSFTYSHSSVDRFTFRGTEIVETVLIGVVEAEDADRDFFEAATTARYGVTDRIEVEVRVPFVYRDDDLRTSANIGGTDVQLDQGLDTQGIGDIEFGGRYQLNAADGQMPTFIFGLRGKTTTGQGPFDVDRDGAGVETELPTGSGFYSVEPGLSMIYTSDPLVLFANVGYLWNIERNVDEDVGGSEIGNVDPGDAYRFGFGFSFSVNENSSFSLGYSQDMIRPTETEVDGVNLRGESLTVGSVTFGLSHRINERTSIDIGTTFGVTGDATDVSLGFRIPTRFQLF